MANNGGWLMLVFLTLFSACKAEPQKVTIGFMGDVMLGRLMNNAIAQKGYNYPWGNLLPELHQTDLNIASLKLVPVLIDNFQVNHATGQDAQWSLKRMQKLSDELGTTVTADGTWRR